MELNVTILTGTILSLSIILNCLAEHEKKKRRRNICWTHNRGVMFGGAPSKSIKKNIFVDKKCLEMHNSGTPLSEEDETLHYMRIKPDEGYVGRGFVI